MIQLAIWYFLHYYDLLIFGKQNHLDAAAAGYLSRSRNFSWKINDSGRKMIVWGTVGHGAVWIFDREFIKVCYVEVIIGCYRPQAKWELN